MAAALKRASEQRSVELVSFSSRGTRVATAAPAAPSSTKPTTPARDDASRVASMSGAMSKTGGLPSASRGLGPATPAAAAARGRPPSSSPKSGR